MVSSPQKTRNTLSNTSKYCNDQFKKHLYRHDMEDIGQRIAVAREAKRLAQIDLAKMLGVTAQAVQQWEAGKTLHEAADTLQRRRSSRNSP